MRTLLAIVLLATLPAWADVVSRVEGRVLTDHVALPGVTVTLTGTSFTHRAISNEEGRYSFLAIPGGAYELTFELNGLENERLDLFVDTERTVVPDVALQLSPIMETVTISCSFGRSCSDTEPETPFDLVPCADYHLNTALIESINLGDASAITLLQKRYKATIVHTERHRLAGALLAKVIDDREYWNELSERATEAIRFAFVEEKPTEEFVQWCAARSVDPHDYHWMTLDALTIALADRRARPLLIRSLESEDPDLVAIALTSILHHRDESLLPTIEQVLERFPEDAGDLAFWLLAFRSDAADRVAMKYLPEDRVEEYREQQRQLEAASP